MNGRDAVASLRPRPCGPPLRGRATLRDGVSRGGLVTARNTEQATTDSTLNSPVRGLRLGGGAPTFCANFTASVIPVTLYFTYSYFISFQISGFYVFRFSSENNRHDYYAKEQLI
jgi:hypothetical protein